MGLQAALVADQPAHVVRAQLLRHLLPERRAQACQLWPRQHLSSGLGVRVRVRCRPVGSSLARTCVLEVGALPAVRGRGQRVGSRQKRPCKLWVGVEDRVRASWLGHSCGEGCGAMLVHPLRRLPPLRSPLLCGARDSCCLRAILRTTRTQAKRGRALVDTAIEPTARNAVRRSPSGTAGSASREPRPSRPGPWVAPEACRLLMVAASAGVEGSVAGGRKRSDGLGDGRLVQIAAREHVQ